MRRVIPLLTLLSLGLAGCGSTLDSGPIGLPSTASPAPLQAEGLFGKKLDPRDYPLMASIVTAKAFTKERSNLGKRFSLKGRIVATRKTAYQDKVLYELHFVDHTASEPHFLYQVWNRKFDAARLEGHVTVYFTVKDFENWADPQTLAEALRTEDGRIHFFSRL